MPNVQVPARKTAQIEIVLKDATLDTGPNRQIGADGEGTYDEIAVGDHAAHLTFFDDRKNADVCLAHELGGLGERRRWLDRDDIADHHISDLHSCLLSENFLRLVRDQQSMSNVGSECNRSATGDPWGVVVCRVFASSWYRDCTRRDEHECIARGRAPLQTRTGSARGLDRG